MFCIHCGKQLPDTAAFCDFCGKATADIINSQSAPANPQPTPVYTQPALTDYQQESPQYTTPVPPTKSDSRGVLRIILGIALLLCGLYPYVFQDRIVFYINSSIVDFYTLGDYYVAASSVFTSFFGFLEPILRFPASMAAVITGIALLQNRPGAKTPAIVSGILNCLSILGFGLVLILLTQPRIILSLFLSGTVAEEVYAALLQLPLLDNIRNATLNAMVLALIVVGLSFGSLFVMPKQLRHAKPDRSLSGLLVMLYCLVFYQIFANFLPSILAGNFMGTTGMLAFSNANGFVTQQTSSVFFLLFLILLVIAVVFRKPPFHLSALVVGGGLLMCCGGLYKLTAGLDAYAVPEAILEMVQEMYVMNFWGHALMLIAVCIWIVAVTRNAIPLWLQWVLSCVIVPAYILAEVSGLAIVRLGTPGVGQIVCAIVILGTTVTVGLLRTGKKYC